MADVDVDLRLEPRDLGRELAGQHVERLEVERDAGRLHPGQHRDERQLELAVQPVEAVVDETPLERLADGDRGQRLEAGPGRAVELDDRRQDEVELLGHDVGDGLAAQRGIEDVGGDLGIERDRRGGRVGIVGDARDEERLDLVGDDRGLQPVEQPAQRRGVVRAFDRDRPAIRPRDGQRQRDPAPRSRIVEQQPDTDRGLGGKPRLERRDGRPAWTSIRDGSVMAAASAVGRSPASIAGAVGAGTAGRRPG